MSPVRVHEDAEAEYLEAVAWYQARNPLVAGRFRESVAATVAALLSNPDQWSKAPDVPEKLNVRRILVRGFPYAVVFMALETETVVLAIAHGRRRPGYWRGRMPETG